MIGALLLMATGCTKAAHLPPTWARPDCPSATAADYYFPAGMFHPRFLDLDERMVNSNSKILRASGERSLSCGDVGLGGTVFRFFWDRTFEGGPLVIRVSALAEGPHIVAVELDPKGENTVWKSERKLSSAEWTKIVDDVHYADVEGMESYQIGGKDGTDWNFELRREGFYKLVRRWSPRHTAFKDLCLGLIRLSGANIPADDLL